MLICVSISIGNPPTDKEKMREKRDKERAKERAKVEKEKENEEETIKVYDGYGALRKRLFRTVTIHKMCSKDELLLAAMKAYVVSQDSRNFYLLDVYGSSDGDREEEIEDPTPVLVRYTYYIVIYYVANINFSTGSSKAKAGPICLFFYRSRINC